MQRYSRDLQTSLPAWVTCWVRVSWIVTWSRLGIIAEETNQLALLLSLPLGKARQECSSGHTSKRTDAIGIVNGSLLNSKAGGYNRGMGLLRKISIEEVSQHTSRDDCWFIIHGRVYDITGLLENHPGGTKILLKYAGRDATLPFDDVGHSMESLIYDMAPGSYLGEVDGGENVNSCSSVVSWRSLRWLRSWGKGASDDATVRSLGSQSEKLESDLQNWLQKTLLLLVICVCCVLLLVIRYHNRTRRAGRIHSTQAPLPPDTSGMPSWWDLVPT
ncbi:ADL085Cp [Eremothecium gossypii ATCC 10895]|uniref:ADL085Cp n=1 Tax=Eremothecium gossypii (strain ATCC 10895 / CBS 109.51 / FGSC 9923 / NRRL Y-1056) TaxID=284811 RepID=Q75AL2_EREGS|nr:ADL085Cp [Eremothecium gossypii ATCC 10895]AAS51835.1 ADL085Cp [Eremothecium gossypii ATCC 10895]AEY96132.1 FADL085Cp [Eremothecium gossypii FDAG1]